MSSGQSGQSGQDKDKDKAGPSEPQHIKLQIQRKVPKQVVEGRASADFDESYEDLHGTIDLSKLSKFATQEVTGKADEGAQKEGEGEKKEGGGGGGEESKK
ncbi:MAG: hypothetical protein Q9191_007879 [Dirinaria sp. TL-2023a]